MARSYSKSHANFLLGTALISAAIDELLLRGFHRLPLQLTWRLNDRVLQRIREHGKQLAPRVVRCQGGFRLLIDPADWIGSHVALKREFEPGLTRLVQRFLKPGDHFIDVGANIGYFSLLAAAVVGSAGRVSAFEASPITRQALVRNIALNGLQEHVTVHETAVWDSDAELSFYQGPMENAGLSGLGENSRAVASFRVKAEPLDRSVAFREQPVSFVKLDVEGAEYNALAGMIELIRECRPAIALELSPRLLRVFGRESRDLLNLVTQEFRYAVHLYDRLGCIRVADVEALSREQDQQENLLLVPVERGAR